MDAPPFTLPRDLAMALDGYDPEAFFDELFADRGRPRPGVETLIQKLATLEPGELWRRQKAAEKALLDAGITFNVYGHESGVERIFPFDILPRVLPAAEWDFLERGLRQRICALNLFLQDLYGEQRIIKEGVAPPEIIFSSTGYRKACRGLSPPFGLWVHVSGIDIVRDGDGGFYVLEDNLRCPSGVSYVLGNRQVMKRAFPQLFEALNPRPVEDYPSRLLDLLQFLALKMSDEPCVALLTPGIHNSAYFEHSFLARQMGVELVTGSDLLVRDDTVFMRTTRGMRRVHVLYRRIDDDFLDPAAFRADSLLGVPGLLQAYRKGRVALANAPGTGVADDKVVYALLPRIIEFYLAEKPLLANVETHLCWEADSRRYVLEHLDELVVKTANDSGGYGVLIGPHASKAKRAEWAARIEADPRNFIAQPTLSLSRAPVLFEEGVEGRHVDLRPFVLHGRDTYVLPGGLTRVALKKGSLMVNSSQGGGSKDTWVC